MKLFISELTCPPFLRRRTWHFANVGVTNFIIKLYNTKPAGEREQPWHTVEHPE